MEKLTNNPKVYSLCEAVADIAFIAGENKYYNGNSREDIASIIYWAIEFEEINNDIKWGIDSEMDYIDAITLFVNNKMKNNGEIRRKK